MFQWDWEDDAFLISQSKTVGYAILHHAHVQTMDFGHPSIDKCFFRVSVSQNVCMSVCLYVRVSVYQSVYMSGCLYIRVSICQGVCKSVSVCQGICMSVYEGVCVGSC